MRKIGESYYVCTLYSFLEAKTYTVGNNILFACTLHVRDKYLSYAKLMKKNVNLKGLSHEIELGLTVGRGWFLNFLGAPMIL
jgi:hypothetical protein